MMQSKLCSVMFFIIIAMIILIIPEETAAQSLCLHRNHDQMLTVEVIRPNYKHIKRRRGVYYSFRYFYDLGYPAKFYNGAWYPIDYSAFNSLIVFISYRRPFSNKLLFTAELPCARTEFDIKINDGYAFFRYNGYESSIGNPYLGLELGRKASWLAGGIGVRLPMISDKYVNIIDVCANAVPNRLEAFHKYASINATGTFRLRHKIGLGFQLKTGLIYLLNRENSNWHFWHIPSSLLIGFYNDRMSFNYFIHFRMEYSYRGHGHYESSGIIGVTTDVRFGSLRPGAHLGLSYHEGYRILDFGFHLGYHFKY